jgi:hypothetical protein
VSGECVSALKRRRFGRSLPVAGSVLADAGSGGASPSRGVPETYHELAETCNSRQDNVPTATGDKVCRRL